MLGRFVHQGKSQEIDWKTQEKVASKPQQSQRRHVQTWKNEASRGAVMMAEGVLSSKS